MTIQDIALFKSFIEGKVLREIFIRGYRKSAHFSNNPVSIEQYLAEVKAEDVIKKGITLFSANQVFGFDFWENTNQNWLIRLKQGRMHRSYTDYHMLIELEGMFKVLRENWDAAKSWLYEDVDKALKRLGLQEEIAESQTKEQESKKKEEEVNTPTKPLEEEPETSEDSNLDDDLEFFDLTSYSRTKSNKLGKNEASLNFRNGSYKIIFNQIVSKKAKDNGYKYVRLGRTKNGDVILQLHNQEEPVRPVNLRFIERGAHEGSNACINSKDLCEKLKVLLNLTGDYFVLQIEELSSDLEKANYKISK